MRRIAFVITGLGAGGAQTMLLKVLSRIDRERFAPRVISLTGFDEQAELFESLGIPVHCLGMRRGAVSPKSIWALRDLLAEERPHLVQTWMYHADLLGGIAAKLAGRLPVIWNIRHSNLEMRSNKLTTVLTARVCARLSRTIPERVICCAEEAKATHVRIGYAPERVRVIPNGFEVERFAPDPDARDSVAREFELPAEAFLIGLVARYDRQKDHGNFIAAAREFSQKRDSAYFLLCGDGITWENDELAGAIRRAGIAQRFRLLGRRNDIPRLTAALDLAALSSCGEGFPNAVGEAMACGVPCVVTDVGDSARIVGETGVVVPPRDASALCRGWLQVATMSTTSRLQLGAAARRRVLTHYALDAVVNQYQTLYDEVLTGSS